jgi:hypothetical protein
MAKIDIVITVQTLIASDEEDTEKSSTRIAQAYDAADPACKEVIDDIFISLCGYSLKTIIAGGVRL